jgi:hypothetical protein
VALSIQLVALFVPVLMGVYGRPRGNAPAILSMLLGFGTWLVTSVIEHLEGSLPEAVFTAVTTVPSEFWGLGFSIRGLRAGATALIAAGRAGRLSESPGKPAGRQRSWRISPPRSSCTSSGASTTSPWPVAK